MPDDTTINLEFEPFYDRIAANVCGKVVLVFGIGGLFLLVYAMATHWRLDVHQITLACLISCAVLFQYYATDTFRDALPEMVKKLKDKVPESPANNLPEKEKKAKNNGSERLKAKVDLVLSDKRFKIWGLSFAIVNLLFGFLFGLPAAYPWPGPALASWGGFLLAGFVCGIPVCGVYGVWQTVRTFAKDPDLEMDFYAPDNCGGFAFIGQALIRFAMVTAFEGILIGTYILKMPWSHLNKPYVQVLLGSWIAWPFLVSTFVLFVPVCSLHRALKKKKEKEDERIQANLRKIDEKIELAEDSQCLEDLLKKYNHFAARREAVYRTKTWPYDFETKVSYFGVTAANFGGAVKQVHENEWLQDLLKNIF